MARQGLPATFSQDSQKLIPYWERELRENRNLMGIIERDVNLALETIDNLAEKRKVNYEAIRGQLTFGTIQELNLFSSKEMVFRKWFQRLVQTIFEETVPSLSCLLSFYLMKHTSHQRFFIIIHF